jgi:hydroxypyruvate isomerase
VEYTGYLDFWFTDFPYRNIARKLHELKFDGFVGMEFAPTGSESAAFRSVQEIIQ